uniref:Smr domain-containing protein n=1 Tax=Octactis speculum TaxID=3111310 RepID=A0A7S2DE44_9STRA
MSNVENRDHLTGKKFSFNPLALTFVPGSSMPLGTTQGDSLKRKISPPVDMGASSKNTPPTPTKTTSTFPPDSSPPQHAAFASEFAGEVMNAFVSLDLRQSKSGEPTQFPALPSSVVLGRASEKTVPHTQERQGFSEGGHAHQLRELFPSASAQKIRSVIAATDADMDAAVACLLAETQPPNKRFTAEDCGIIPSGFSMAQSVALQHLLHSLPLLPPAAVRDYFVACGGDAERTQEALFIAEPEGFLASVAASEFGVGPGVTTAGTKLFIAGHETEPWPPTLASLHLSSEDADEVIASVFAPSAQPDAALQEAIEWRAEASEQFAEMQNTFARANRPDLAPVARQHRAALRHANAMAAAATVRAHNPDESCLWVGVTERFHDYKRLSQLVVKLRLKPNRRTTRVEVDLHGLQVKEALGVVQQLLSCPEKCPLLVSFIVGRGTHSCGGKARLLNAVRAMVLRRGLTMDSTEGVITIDMTSIRKEQ